MGYRPSALKVLMPVDPVPLLVGLTLREVHTSGPGQSKERGLPSALAGYDADRGRVAAGQHRAVWTPLITRMWSHI